MDHGGRQVRGGKPIHARARCTASSPTSSTPAWSTTKAPSTRASTSGSSSRTRGTRSRKRCGGTDARNGAQRQEQVRRPAARPALLRAVRDSDDAHLHARRVEALPLLRLLQAPSSRAGRTARRSRFRPRRSRPRSSIASAACGTDPKLAEAVCAEALDQMAQTSGRELDQESDVHERSLRQLNQNLAREAADTSWTPARGSSGSSSLQREIETAERRVRRTRRRTQRPRPRTTSIADDLRSTLAEFDAIWATLTTKEQEQMIHTAGRQGRLRRADRQGHRQFPQRRSKGTMPRKSRVA